MNSKKKKGNFDHMAIFIGKIYKEAMWVSWQIPDTFLVHLLWKKSQIELT